MPWPSDQALPQLHLLRDLDVVSAALPDWRATRRLHLRYVPARSCVATYDLVALGNGGARRSIGVVVVGPGGLDARLYVDDPALPGLAAVADGAISGRRLGLDGGGATPVRYRPGSRCTLVMSDQCGAVRAFAKVLPAAERLRAATSVVGAAGVAVPEELAWRPDLACLVQRAVPGATPLGRLLPEHPGVAGAAGVALGRLHASTDAPGWPVVGVGDDLARLEGLRAAVAAAVPEVLDAFDEALVALRPARCPAVGAVPSHGAYRAGQVVVDQNGRAVVLDLDGTCRAEPARDVGNFLAYLRWQALRMPDQAPALAAAREAFIEGYGSVAPSPEGTRVARCEALSLVKIAGRRARDLSADEWPLLPALLGAARGLVSAPST
jgi:hypothetical protein